VSASKDLLFTGRETRPIHEAVALNSTPYLPGLTGSKDKVLSILHQSGLRLKEGGSWRTISSLEPQEKGKLIETIAGILASSDGATVAMAGLVGEVYTLTYEDEFTPLRDAREFGTLLNACGRMGLTGIGIEICIGERSNDLDLAIAKLSDYRASIGKSIDSLLENPSRTRHYGDLVLVRAEGLVDEQLLGPVISILASSQTYRDKAVVAITQSEGSDMKVSSRVGDLYAGDVNLGLVMREAAEKVNGVGGGHTMAAGARIPAQGVEAFSELVRERFSR
jgi:RecJ-like exonuclease